MLSPRLAFAAPLFALVALTGCSTDAPKSPYDVYMVRGCAADLEHDEYDPALPGYWLVGTDGMIQISLAKDAVRPDSYSFMIRTRASADEAKPSRLEKVLFLTPRYRIITGFADGKAKPVDIIALMEKKEGTEIVPVESDKAGRYVTFEQVGARVKVTLTAKGLEIMGNDLTFTWGETSGSGAKNAEDEAAKAEARARRLM